MSPRGIRGRNGQGGEKGITPTLNQGGNAKGKVQARRDFLGVWVTTTGGGTNKRAGEIR